MSSYKPYTPRRPAESTEHSSNDKLKPKVEKLQELFPTWSSEDLQSVLLETSGDVELAVTRISEGHAEQWGSVTRKKEKKNIHSSHSSLPPRGDRDRLPTEPRGGRGGRGGRGRAGARGASRGAHATSHQRETSSSAAPFNDLNTPSNDTASATKDWSANVTISSTVPSSDRVTEVNTNGTTPSNSWGTKAVINDPNESASDNWTTTTDKPGVTSTTGWTAEPGPETASNATWAPEAGNADSWSSPAPPQNGTSDHSKPKTAPVKTSKIPFGAKLSWAQIARPQEKTKPAPPLAASASLQPPVPVATAPEESLIPVPVPTEPSVPHQEPEQTWEEPTTVQPPTWDDEPPSLPAQPTEPQVSTHDGWITADTVPPHATAQEAWDTSVTVAQDQNWSQTRDETASAQSPQTTTTTTTTTTTPSAPSLAPSTSTSSVATSKPSTPSIANTRPTNAHRNSAKYLKSDQAVVIPAFAGNIGASGEKLGMQFGSLSIGGDDAFDGPFKSDSEQPASDPPPQQTKVSTQTQTHDAAQSPVTSASHGQSFLQPQLQQPIAAQPQQIQSPPQSNQQQQQATQQHQAPQQATQQHQAPQQATQQHQAPQQVSQQQQIAPPFTSHQQAPPALSQQQPQPQQHQPQPLSQHSLSQHHQQQPQHSYAQHGIHTHFDGPPAPQQQPQHTSGLQHQQHASGPQSSAYFRQADSPYYHNPTPPQSAAPEHQGAYATAFSPLGAGQGLGVNQGQASHLGGFGAGGPGDYGYGDGQRGFYEYTQPGSFSNRLSHDEPSKSGLPIAQSSQPASSLTSAGGQPQPSSGPQGASNQPPAGQQGQQQSYPAPMPYYYPPYYAQNSYPTYPNPSYGQAYGMPKYPPVYPPQGPSAPPPANKGPGAAAPYNASASQSHLYHGQGGFEDPTAGYQHHQSSTNPGLGGTDYQKQPQPHQQYPGQGLQSFLSGQAGGGPGAQQRTGASPETAYKPYGVAADKSSVGIGAQAAPQGRAAGVQQAQQQQQAGGTGSFYPGGRFGAGAGGPQQQGQQQGQGYPQSGDQGPFYPYQPRHQGGYWQ